MDWIGGYLEWIGRVVKDFRLGNFFLDLESIG